MTGKTIASPKHGDVIETPLDSLRPSPRNARRMPHAEADIEALAASIAAKGVLQAPVVEPETDAAGAATGRYLVTIGEGRRRALMLLAERGVIRRTAKVRCVVDLAHDAHEISLDENVTRSAMHPADQFEAFRRLSQDRGLSAEEIAARFGVSAQAVRQRLRLGAVAPALMDLYRAGELTLEQLTAFAVSEDHARQAQVLEQLGAYRPPYLIRRAMTEAKVAAQDRRAKFVGADAYGEAGGTILRDLFTEDGGGWFEDVALLDRLVAEKLAGIAEAVRDQEGWKWAEAHVDFPHGLGLGRVYPSPRARSEAETARIQALSEEYDALVVDWEAVEDLPPEVEARFKAIDAELAGFGEDLAYDAADLARGGVLVVLAQDGTARIERGLIRPEDQARPDAEPEAGAADAPPGEGGPALAAEAPEAEAEGPADAPLSDRLVAELTAHRTLALRDALAGSPRVALSAVVHALALAAFYPPYERPSCLQVRGLLTELEVHAPGSGESRAGQAIAERHAAWAARLPKSARALWDAVAALSDAEQLELLAHCAGLTLNAVCAPLDRKPAALAHADRLAEALELDMAAYWTATAASYLGRVTKAQIGSAVREAVSGQAAERIAGLKKPDMAVEAEALLAGTGWLPAVLRRSGPEGACSAAEPEGPVEQAA
jgi:ParB family chromosome partitioning protein